MGRMNASLAPFVRGATASVEGRRLCANDGKGECRALHTDWQDTSEAAAAAAAPHCSSHSRRCRGEWPRDGAQL